MRPLALLLVVLSVPALAAGRPPNVVILLADDAGYADFGFQGSEQFRTPNIDRIAEEGVKCTAGYVSGMVCSPTRAGLLTGRYQNRFGHEFNVPATYSETNGLPTSETTFADLLGEAGYRTAAIGKWHLGYADKFHPLSRGFEDYYGFLQGSRSYWPIEGTPLNRLLRGREPVPERFDYMTDELGRETAKYIEKYKNEPFFLYVCFNAVHGPMHALEEDFEQFPEIADQKRRTLAAMTLSLDRAVGMILDELDEQELAEETLVVFLSDNGGPPWANASNNAPLRGTKGQPFEGGFRVPFALRWPARLPRGVECDKPVIALDLLPTALAAAGTGDVPVAAEGAPPRPLDGVNLIPYLTGEKEGRPHETLYWRNGPDKKAVRDGDWKLVLAEGETLLFDLSRDIAEEQDLAAGEPEVVARLSEKLAAWEAEMEEPRWGPRRRGDRRAESADEKDGRPKAKRKKPKKGGPAPDIRARDHAELTEP